MNNNIIVLNDLNFKDEVSLFKGTYVVDFSADWCGPCNSMKKEFTELAEKLSSSNIKFGKYRLDEETNNKVASSENVKGLPTFRIYREGTTIDTMIGAGDLKGFLKKYIV